MNKFEKIVLSVLGLLVVCVCAFCVNVYYQQTLNRLNLSVNISANQKLEEINKYILLRSVQVDTHYGKCTGVIWQNDKEFGSQVITAKHCTENKHWIEVQGKVPYDVVESNNFDVSVISGPFIENKKEIIFSTELPQVGDNIYHVGLQDEQPLVVDGKYHWNEYVNHIVKIDADFGSSGGGLFNEKGELIGIVSSIYDGDKSGRYTTALSNLAVLDFICSKVLVVSTE